MTYPQPQPQYGYAPQQQPSYPPVPQSQYAPATGGQGITPPVPQLRDGGGGGGSVSPKMRHLLGRTIIVIPHRVDETAMDTSVTPPKPRPEAYFDLVVVDGGPLRYGDNQDRDPAKQRPNTHEIDTPCVFRNANDYGFGFVQATRDALAAGEAGRVGVVQQGTRGNRPYLITKTAVDVEDKARPDGQQRFDAAMAVFGKLWADKHAAPGAPRQFVNPEPRSLVAPPQAGGYPAQPQINYDAPTQPAYPAYPQPAQSPYMPQGYGTPNTGAGVPDAYAVATAYPSVAPGPAPQSAPPAGQPFYGMQPAVPAAQLPPQIEAWLITLPPEQAAGARAQMIAQQQAAAQPAAPAGPGM